MKEYKIIIVIPAGRKRYLEILIPNILSQDGWDELHIWKNTSEPIDVQYIDSLKILDSRILIIEPPRLEPYGARTIGQFFHYCTDKNTVYIRFDDDICYIEPGLVEWLAAVRWAKKEYFLISPCVINNSVASFFLQEENKLKFNYESKISFNCLDSIGWRDSTFAYDLHNYFLDNSVNEFRFPPKELPSMRFSINCISWLGEEFNKFNGIVPDGVDEEEWLTNIKPAEINKKNLILGDKLCCHFSFYTQRKYLDNTEILEKYKKIIPKKYDYLIVGSGFFGSTFARLATDAGKKCLVIDSRNHIGGNAYTEKINNIDIHMYGPHIFHTNNKEIWDFVNKFSSFNNFILSPKVRHNDKLYSLPFNMNTFYELWGCTDPQEAKNIINSQKPIFDHLPKNLEEQALSLVGKDIYNLIIKDYTAKQWMTDPKELPAFIIKRLPLRFTFNSNYFDDRYQGIPVDGYTKLFENMLDGVEVILNVNYFNNKETLNNLTNKVVFTGKIDEYFDYEFGELEYRTLDFIHEVLDIENYQGTAQINYPDPEIPWTRIIEHKHFNKTNSDKTVITKEIPTIWSKDKVPYYPINNDKNNEIYKKYREKADLLPDVIFGGRLAEYQYYDMHQVIGAALKAARIHLA